MGRPLNLTRPDIESNYKEDDDNDYCGRDWAIVFMWSALGYLCIIATVISYFHPTMLPADLFGLLFRKDLSPFFAFGAGSKHFLKPHGFKIVALVPFNYHERTSILDCYLQKNLVQNHGFLDKVVFVPQTNDSASLDWLSSLVKETPAYAMTPPGMGMDWKVANDDNAMYIRIDGDVVFLEDHTIPTIVKTKLDHPNSMMVSANVVNEAALAALHSHPGVALPYLPELNRAEQPSQSDSETENDWRASNLPVWEGPSSFRVQKGFTPPFGGHRWLLPEDPESDRDPIAASVYTDTGPTLQEWTVGAQQHYSFLNHLEANELSRYKFPLWVDPTDPISENFGCFWGRDSDALRDVFQHSKSDPDEFWASWSRADGSRPHVAIDGKGLVSHYSAQQGAAGLDATDLLERYRAYAEERVCRRTS